MRQTPQAIKIFAHTKEVGKAVLAALWPDDANDWVEHPGKAYAPIEKIYVRIGKAEGESWSQHACIGIEYERPPHLYGPQYWKPYIYFNPEKFAMQCPVAQEILIVFLTSITEKQRKHNHQDLASLTKKQIAHQLVGAIQFAGMGGIAGNKHWGPALEHENTRQALLAYIQQFGIGKFLEQVLNAYCIIRDAHNLTLKDGEHETAYTRINRMLSFRTTLDPEEPSQSEVWFSQNQTGPAGSERRIALKFLVEELLGQELKVIGEDESPAETDQQLDWNYRTSDTIDLL